MLPGSLSLDLWEIAPWLLLALFSGDTVCVAGPVGAGRWEGRRKERK